MLCMFKGPNAHAGRVLKDGESPIMPYNASRMDYFQNKAIVLETASGKEKRTRVSQPLTKAGIWIFTRVPGPLQHCTMEVSQE